MFNKQLFQSERVLLEPYDPENDAVIEAGFTRYWEYAWAFDVDADPHPLSAYQIKKKREEQLKKSDEAGDRYYFVIRTREDQRMIGVLGLPWVSWSNHLAWMQILIGLEEDIPIYLPEVLEMGMRFAFEELNMHYLVMSSGEFAPVTLNLLLTAGFKVQVRQRRYVFYNNRFWDRLILGLPQAEWKSLHKEYSSHE